ncbi:MAG: CHAD domain-containing protein [Terriglobia bacterium]|jgi:CHAD domain-containing protein
MDDEARQVNDAAGGEPSPPPGPSIAEDFPAPSDAAHWKKVRGLALRQLNRFMSYEARVLKGDNPEAIHDMRVASRRLQQVLDVLYAKPRPQELRRLRRQIRRCRQVLGDVRNCDVLLDLVKRSLARKRSARREAWTAVQHHLLMCRSESFLRAMRKFGKINLAVLYVNLKEFLAYDKAHAHAAEHHHHASPPERPAFSNQLAHALQSGWRAFEDQVTLSFHDSRPAVIHGARIATKRLRYLLEVFHAFEVAGSAEALAWLRQLQQQLGDWHDREVLEQMMIEMLARPKFLREHLLLAMEVEKLILRNRENKVGLEAKYFQMSRESPDMRRVKDWVSYLLESPSAAFAKVTATG